MTACLLYSRGFGNLVQWYCPMLRNIFMVGWFAQIGFVSTILVQSVFSILRNVCIGLYGWMVSAINKFFVIILGNKSFIILCGFGQRQYLLFYTDMRHDFFILQIERTYISLLIYIFSFCTMDSMLYTIQFPLPPGKKIWVGHYWTEILQFFGLLFYGSNLQMEGRNA